MTEALTMFDGCDPTKLPKLPPPRVAGGQMVAGYLDGPCRWPGSGWSAFPHARKVRISIEANVLADVFDWENGTASLTVVRHSIALRAQVYLPSVVYCSRSRWEIAKQDLSGLPVAWWVADWTGKEHLVEGSVATQWARYPYYDVSIVAPGWPKGA